MGRLRSPLYTANKDSGGNVANNHLLEDLRNTLEQYIRLQDGWDGYRGVPVSRALADKAYAIARAITRAGMPCDRILASTGNGLSIELNIRCGGLSVLLDVEDDEESESYDVFVRSRNATGNRQYHYQVVCADSWTDLVNKVKERM